MWSRSIYMAKTAQDMAWTHCLRSTPKLMTTAHEKNPTNPCVVLSTKALSTFPCDSSLFKRWSPEMQTITSRTSYSSMKYDIVLNNAIIMLLVYSSLHILIPTKYLVSVQEVWNCQQKDLLFLKHMSLLVIMQHDPFNTCTSVAIARDGHFYQTHSLLLS